MAVLTYTKAGAKATTAAKLDAKIFDIEVKNHDLLKDAYVGYLANGRVNLAKTKNRGDVSGGGKKPWQQKGTGRARFGSSRNPIWRGGGVAFGPTGEENYTRNLSTRSRRQALVQALSLANKADKLIVIESFVIKEGKSAQAVKLLGKLGINRTALIVADTKDLMTARALANIPNVKYVQAKYLNVFDVLNADKIVLDQNSLAIISEWLTPPAKAALPAKVSKKLQEGK